jgi:hypothetical protein
MERMERMERMEMKPPVVKVKEEKTRKADSFFSMLAIFLFMELKDLHTHNTDIMPSVEMHNPIFQRSKNA